MAITPPKTKLVTKKPATPQLGVAMPTGYMDQSQINAAPPGVAPTTISPQSPKVDMGQAKKLGAVSTPPGAKGAIIPGNDAKMQEMMGTSTAKIGQAGQAGAKTPENVAADNKNYKGLLKKFGLY